MADDVCVRRATPADVPGIAQVHVLSWHSTYAGIIPDAEIARYTLQRRAAMWTRALQVPATNAALFVAMRGDELLGFASTGPFRVEPPHTPHMPDTPGPASAEGQGDGELNALYLLQSAHRQGIGRRLFEAGAHGLREAAFGAMRCWVLERNAAIAFYERMGGVRVASKNFSVDGATLVEHCYRFDLH